jgi:hypothetical protein
VVKDNDEVEIWGLTEEDNLNYLGGIATVLDARAGVRVVDGETVRVSRILHSGTTLICTANCLYKFDQDCVPAWLPPFTNDDNMDFQSEDPIWLNR